MPTTDATPAALPDQRTDTLAGFLSYLIPGLGQMSQGRFSKGLLFFVCLLGLFHVGQAMGNWQNVYMPREGENPFNRQQGRVRLNPISSIYNRWHFAGQFWTGIAAWPAIWQFYEMPVPDAKTSPFWHNYQKVPLEEDVNNFLRDHGKGPDLGWVFTVIAGMLNILVIYDAYAGPAFRARTAGPQGQGPKNAAPSHGEVSSP